MKFTQLRSDTFQSIAINAGILSYSVSINGTTGEATVHTGSIIGATSGGITVTAVPTFKDFAEDIDNASKNTKEAKHLVSYEVKASGTFASLHSEAAQQLLGSCTEIVDDGVISADKDVASWKTYYTRTGSGTAQSPYVFTAVSNPSATHLASSPSYGGSDPYYKATSYKLTPSHAIADGDFTDLWFIGDYSDDNDGTDAGYIAIKIVDAFTTGGFSMVTVDEDKAKFAFEFTGHYSIDDPEDVPLDIYVHQGGD